MELIRSDLHRFGRLQHNPAEWNGLKLFGPDGREALAIPSRQRTDPEFSADQARLLQ